jgi:hypothetical protein
MKEEQVGATTGAPGGFIGWITTYGSIIGFFVQLAFYIVVAASAAWAAVTFARYVKFMTGDEIVVEGEDGKPVSVEEFVE